MKLFHHVKTDPNPNVNLELWEHRLKKRRPFVRNPFEVADETSSGYGLTTIETPVAIQDQTFNLVQGQPSDKTSESSKIEEDLTTQKERANRDMEWGEQVPSWLNLFYDLAWTATFASLTSNNKFREPWDSVSYITFFVSAWWIWASQVCYNVEFYTDDWFHLIFIFLQLTIFGALAATTKGFDVTNYILQSPGAQELQAYDMTKISPERYKDERLAKISLHVIMLMLAFSRLLLLIQHLRVVICATLTLKSRRIPFRLLVVPASLVISTVLFFVAFAITNSPRGLQPYGAKLKYILGGVALLVEMIAHIARLHMDMDKGLRLISHGTMVGRFTEITAIILGECINAIAQTFYAIEEAPGFRKTTGASIVCCGIIVFFLAYLYFEGAAPLKPVRRRAAWMMVHLPWLLTVILLLEGVKNQLLLTNFLSTTEYLLTAFGNVGQNSDVAGYNATMVPLMLQSGLTFDQEWRKYVDAMDKVGALNLTEEDLASAEDKVSYAWALRVELSGIWNTYNTFMDNETIPEDTYKKIKQYQDDDNFIARDVESLASGKIDLPILSEIIEELLKPSFINARYITGLSGITFICLATLNLIQSWPRDRFQWASAFSRYAMGFCMLLLLLLNLGKYQHYALKSDQDISKWAGIYKWVSVYAVLPTLAGAYALQFLIDTAIMYFAVNSGRKRIQREAIQAESEQKV